MITRTDQLLDGTLRDPRASASPSEEHRLVGVDGDDLVVLHARSHHNENRRHSCSTPTCPRSTAVHPDHRPLGSGLRSPTLNVRFSRE
jgi:hypothetical protein